MVYIPFNENQWLLIEANYRDHHPMESRKNLPVREVAAWFATWIVGRLD
jgi:hypothetical protein